MGRGNFCVSGELGFQWYIDHDLYSMEDEANEYTTDYDMLQDDIESAVREIQHRFPSFSERRTMVDNCWAQEVLAENSLFVIGIADNQWSEAVFIKARDDLYPEDMNLARRHFNTYCDGIQRILLDMFGEVCLRCSAWTHQRITRKEQRA